MNKNLTSGLIRKKIYNYVYDNILPRNHSEESWRLNVVELRRLLKLFYLLAKIEKDQPPQKIKIKKYNKGAFNKENDLRNGVWRPDEDYK